MKLTSFAKYAWLVLAYNIGVILFGAYVRATGSGAGCGSHWPLCNGEVIPRSPEIETLIELSHRLTSGVALIFVVVLFALAFKIYPRGHTVRLGASFSLLFIITEALVGAGLVLFEWVASDASIGRAFSITVHLVNTFMLLASLGLTAWWGSGGKPIRISGQGIVVWGFGIGFVGVILIGITGAITALGDTLFPIDSLAEGIRQDFSATSHFLLRLRVWHPVVAIIIGFYTIFLSLISYLFFQKRQTRIFAILLLILFIVQLIAGLVNLILLAPLWMQIVHLLLADLVWITLVLLAANTFAIKDEAIQMNRDIADSEIAALDLISQTEG